MIIPSGSTEDRWIQAGEYQPRALNRRRRISSRAYHSWLHAWHIYKAFPGGEAILVKAGSDFVVQLHFTPSGTATTDVSSFGFAFSKGPPSKRLTSFSAAIAMFVIPPGDPDYAVKGAFTVGPTANC